MRSIFVAKDLAPDTSPARRSVRGMMSAPVSVVAAHSTLDHALRAMVRAGHRHLVVVTDDGTCHGVLTDRLLSAEWVREAASFDRRHVVDILPVADSCLTADSTVADAARRMRETGTDAVAVVDATGTAIGVVTAADFVRLLAT